MASGDPDRTDDRCPEPEELTAFAAGERSEAWRAVVSRHLLRCAACRADRDEAAAVLGRLRAFATSAGWADDLAAAAAAVRGERRARRRASIGGVAAAALLATALAAAPRRSDRGPVDVRVAAAAADPAAEAALLRAQAPDGHWSAPTLGDEEAATGLAILALLDERPGTLAAGPVARAVAGATRWLRARQTEDGRFGRAPAGGDRGHALATEALLEVWAATGDAGLRTMLAPAVRCLAADARRDAADAWTRHALARARSVGWRTPEDAGAASPAPAWAPPGTPDASPCSRVLAWIAR